MDSFILVDEKLKKRVLLILFAVGCQVGFV